MEMPKMKKSRNAYMAPVTCKMEPICISQSHHEMYCLKGFLIMLYYLEGFGLSCNIVGCNPLSIPISDLRSATGLV